MYRLVQRDDAGRVFFTPLVDGVNRIGRLTDGAVVLDDPTVSKVHAEITVDSSGVRIADLRSTNGVFVNGVRTTGAVLRPGDEIQLGDVTLVLEEGEVDSA